ncbi:ribosomal silencing factor RsfS [Bacillus pakistanensis]|uniref:Ribosomal silencing factor RsfS n=1 Tax=Rossellomorea pakistanensis TaxID=992288 RepID=A0ABS2N8U7_9BACI|nr:YpjP family protein [Bacillus pakistanensis]MBM7584258.1 ribosomal silencing factor RsfS [Bacillus pakistanensis]
MANWVRKSFVVLVSILTFGLVTPAQAVLNNNEELSKQNNKQNFQSEKSSEDQQVIYDHQHFVQNMMEEAEKQSYIKFGDKIKPVIEDEFKTVILPKMEEAISSMASQYPEEDLSSFEISEVPSYAKSEKIFHILDSRTGKDIIRFHVRKDHPPLEGYYFNFHYHTHRDDYQSHHHLGSIYWDKNTPPQWMSVS